MIVKDEARVIERCLAAVLPYIDSWVIVDTGSADGTQALIRRHLACRPGALYERPWVNFGHNRTEALELARGKADYVLFMDADNIFCAPSGWGWPDLTADAYYLTLTSSGTQYQQCLLVADHLRWRWVGVLHEYLTTDAPHQIQPLSGPWVDRRHEGARSRDPDTFRKDAVILEDALKAEPTNARYAFYLAQSWRDAGVPTQAREAYRRRAAMGGWEEEVWYALYEVAKLTQQLNGTPAEISKAYLDAYQLRPCRAEPLVALTKWHNHRREWALAWLFAKTAITIPKPKDILFLDEAVYQWTAFDEAAIAAFWAGDHLECFALCQKLLDEDRLPETERGRVELNRDYAVPAVAEHTAVYPQELVRFLSAKDRLASPTPGVTLTITSCKRLALFEKTVNSFLNCAKDAHLISRFICIDDNSAPVDRERMQALYPFFEFIFKGPEEKGHALSMNRLREAVGTRYWLHLEDDWHFVVPSDYVSRSIAILKNQTALGQVVFNRNYAETLDNRTLVGGTVQRLPESGLRYVLHEHTSEGAERDAFFARFPSGSLSNTWWPHFSLQPSLLDTERVRSVGAFSEAQGHFERDFASRYMEAGWRTAFFDAIVCFHIGRLIAERGTDKLNAYELNQMVQFKS